MSDQPNISSSPIYGKFYSVPFLKVVLPMVRLIRPALLAMQRKANFNFCQIPNFLTMPGRLDHIVGYKCAAEALSAFERWEYSCWSMNRKLRVPQWISKGPGMGQLHLLSGLQIASQTLCLTFNSSSSAEWGHTGVYASMDTSGACERRVPVCGKPVSPLKHLPQCQYLNVPWMGYGGLTA